MLNTRSRSFVEDRRRREDKARRWADLAISRTLIPPKISASKYAAVHMTSRRTFILAALAAMSCPALAQQATLPYVRWAELEVNADDVNAALAAARENTSLTMANEPGVLAFHSAMEKGNPGRMRVLEVYANAEAYRTHLESPHFQKFARDVQPLLRSRAVYEAVPIFLGAKPELPEASPLTHVRVAELEIDPAQLDAYKAAVSEEIADSIRLEPGVLAIYSLALKDRPAHLRFFEVYADEAAYRQHIEAPHFKKYVATTKSMIRDRKLFEMDAPTLAARRR
jgi:quinol monooxygenase YgiN